METSNFIDPFSSPDYVATWLAESSARAKSALMRDTYRSISEALIRVAGLPDSTGKIGRAIGALTTSRRMLVSKKNGVIDRRLSYDSRAEKSATIYIKIRMQSIALMLVDPRVDSVTEHGLRQAMSVLKNHGHLVGADEQRLDRYAGLLDKAVESHIARRKRFRQ